MDTNSRMLFCWICMVFAVIFEVGGSAIMKYSSGSPWALQGLLIMYVCLGFSYFFLAKAALGLPIGVAYAFWEGFGLFLVSLLSVFFLGEMMTLKRFIALIMVLCGTMMVHHGTGRGDLAREGA